MNTLETQDALDRAARRLLAIRQPHQDLASAMGRLLRHRLENPLADLEVVSVGDIVARPAPDFAPLPDEGNTRPPDLIDRYPSGTAEYHRAMDRLAGAALRHHTKEAAR